MTDTEQFLTPHEAGEALSLSHRTIYREIEKGRIEARKFGHVWMVPHEQINKVRRQDWYKRRLRRGKPKD